MGVLPPVDALQLAGLWARRLRQGVPARCYELAHQALRKDNA